MTVEVIGMPVAGGESWPPAERLTLKRAAVVAVAPRLLADVDGLVSESAQILTISADIDGVLGAIDEAERAGRTVAVVASGDPGLFGIGRALAERLGRERVRISPAASSVAVAFGRFGLPWDDAVVVSAHGRAPEAALGVLRACTKAAVLTSPDVPPQHIGTGLLAIAESVGKQAFEHAAVASNLGAPDERLGRGDLEWLAGGNFAARSVVLLWNGTGISATPVLTAGGVRQPGAFGRGEEAFEHRHGMITKSEVRAVCLARLELPATGVLWDVGAGSGAVAIEAAAMAPGLRVMAIEQSADDAVRIARNARHHGSSVEVIVAKAPGCLADLPQPDRVFVGGGGLDVIDAALERIATRGRVVATFTSMERAAAAARRLGSLTQIAVNRGVVLPDGSWRLSANDPVFVCAGPQRAAR
ncbi:MAG: precorrin-6y C5,15-methyltransferase (decarboxylating) subunit CbiE [Acidimicrobiales bacterium]